MRSNPEKRSSHLLRGGNLKSGRLVLYFSTSGRKRVAAFPVVKANILLHKPQQVYKPKETHHTCRIT